jgi:hypothetical protein
MVTTTGSPKTIAEFSEMLGMPLRPYQLTCAEAIVRSVLARDGRIFTVMFARQMGKNELSAQIEAYLLWHFRATGGTIVKAAPSFRPQLITSLLRLKRTLDSSDLTKGAWTSQFGYMIAVGEAQLTLLSANHAANVVGATAGLLLEIDEAQDVDPDKYDREFRPMAASTNATTVLYGTAWNETSLLERQRRLNVQRGDVGDDRVHFEYPWTVLAEIEPAYRMFVTAEIARLGEDHPTIQTQYLLHPLADAGRLFDAEQRAALRGVHSRERMPREGEMYVAGIDLAGEDEESERARLLGHVPRHDSTVVTIGRVTRQGGAATIDVVEHVWWTGKEQVWQYEELLRLWERWRFARVAVDASGIGLGIASFLQRRHGSRLERVVFSAQTKSALAYEMLSAINTGKLSIYRDDGSAEHRECWDEITACRYAMRSGEQMAWEVPPAEGHDDFVSSLSLCCRAARDVAAPPFGGLVRARGYDADSVW